ncbi:MAG: class II fructose-bisphosphate aldolase [Gemmatimonadota bacterium]|jgi:fructose/tagatose bisphosphate aldolase|nr:class II fructose-bisphosphate aldolase [Gemmatimonadota bacterium]
MADMQSASTEDLAILGNELVVALLEEIAGSIRIVEGRVEVVDPETLRSRGIDRLVHAAVFSPDLDVRDSARWIIGEAAAEMGIVPASIHELYIARGRGEVSGFTVPAMNIRAATWDTGRALFAAARKLEVGALICEIARSEIGYTDQRPAEYVAVITAAALKEGWSGPLFIQGDHFQINAKKYAADPEPELRAVKDLIHEAITAGFYNIDVDTSTLVDLSKDTLPGQQETNFSLSADLTAFIRRLEPRGVTISVGGEIGEVGTENSTPEELRVYMTGFNTVLKELGGKTGRELPGLSKISVQSGTSHGGVVLPDGSIAEVAIDFETLRSLSEIARREFHLGGAVQHGASTLPQTAFGKFPEIETAEIHLATNFQNMLFDHPALPVELRERMYEHCRTAFPEERKPTDTEQQFLYKARKKAIGVFKRELWELPEERRAEIRQTLSQQFAYLFEQLRVAGTGKVVAAHVPVTRISRSGPSVLRGKAAADDWDLSD